MRGTGRAAAGEVGRARHHDDSTRRGAGLITYREEDDVPRHGTTTARGYGAAHKALRAWWAPRVQRGRVHCARCRQLIRKGEPWDLGHDDANRIRYRGPEHADCNRRAGAQQRGRIQQHTPAPAPDAPLEENEW